MNPETYNKILESLPNHPENRLGNNWHGFWVNGSEEIMCPTQEAANLIADFFEDCGFDVMHTHHYEDGETDGSSLGWWAVYVDGQ